MVQASAGKNIWVAASDGDIERVRTLVEAGQSPNALDANSYSPMHAAASYSHLELLDYLVSVGGDPNLADADGETPLFVVETLEAARWLVAHGTDAAHVNEEGRTAADVVEEDYADVAAFLRATMGGQIPSGDSGAGGAAGPVSQLAVDAFATRETADLLARTQEIMEQAERDGTDPDARLRAAVEDAVRRGFALGGEVGDAVDAAAQGQGPDDATKRTRGE
ncbi:hypothetical protein Q5752_001552 [Cryptotrichosporon argae]